MSECLEKRNNCCKCYNLVLMDLDMKPGMDGLEAFQKIKIEMNNFVIPWMPIAAFTANFEEEEKCINLGMENFFKKPMDYNSFLNLIPKYFT